PSLSSCLFYSLPPPPVSPLFPYTTLFRSEPLPSLRLPFQTAFALRFMTVSVKRVASTAVCVRRKLSTCTARDDGDVAVSIDSFRDRKSTRLNSSHSQISYAVFCLKKKKQN